MTSSHLKSLKRKTIKNKSKKKDVRTNLVDSIKTLVKNNLIKDW